MPSTLERLNRQFCVWERRGRGGLFWPHPVGLEPPFEPFAGHVLPAAPVADDGRSPSLIASVFGTLFPRPAVVPPEAQEETDSGPEPQYRSPVGVLHVTLPPEHAAATSRSEAFLQHLAPGTEAVSFELVADAHEIVTQFTAAAGDLLLLQHQLQAHYPDAMVVPGTDRLAERWHPEPDEPVALLEIGLDAECMLPLARGKADPLIGVVGALSSLRPGEAASVQVLFQPVGRGWAESFLRAVTGPDGRPFFANRPELVPGAKEKIAQPLFAAVVRVVARAESWDRAWDVVVSVASAYRVFAHARGNALRPLGNRDYPEADHVADVLKRQSRRSGMLLNLSELEGFVHPPSDEVQSPKLRRLSTRSRPCPPEVRSPAGTLLGLNTHGNQTVEVRLTEEQRVRHLHLVGASGTGKSTLLFNLIRADLERGEGVAVLDPHGDLIDRLLGVIPEHRIKDVVLVDPVDEEFCIGFNILSAHSDWERTLLASDLVSVFQRLSSTWGDQLGSVLSNAILAFLESSEGGTLADLRRFLLEPAYRNRFLDTVQDPDVVYYWRKGFTQLSGNRSIGPVLTRLETFLTPKPVRYMVSQARNRLDFADILDSGKVFLARLSQGTMGRENAFLLGSLFMAKFQQAAMARQRQQAEQRRPFWIYVDEFHHFITPSMAEILSGARKYRVGLVLAHQELRQLERDREVASAVLGNPGTRVVFRVGDDDARKLDAGFASFTARDLQNLGTGEAVARVERSEWDFNLTVPKPVEPDPEAARHRREAVIAASRRTYATPRAEIESALRQQFEAQDRENLPVKAKPKPEYATDSEKETVIRPPSLKADSPVVGPLPPFTPLQVGTAEIPKVAEPKPPADLGRGGEQHKAIQKRLKEAAEKLGYRVTTEKPVLDRAGSVDLALEHSRRSLAVEITVTTTIDHEVGNVTKCLKAGFSTVAVVSSSEAKLRQMQEAVSGALGPELSVRVGYFLPDAFLGHLQQLAKEDAAAVPAPPTEHATHGYRVKRKFLQVSPADLKAREEAAVKAIAEAMRKRPE
jgi:hypothetical protein